MQEDIDPVDFILNIQKRSREGLGTRSKYLVMMNIEKDQLDKDGMVTKNLVRFKTIPKTINQNSEKDAEDLISVQEATQRKNAIGENGSIPVSIEDIYRIFENNHYAYMFCIFMEDSTPPTPQFFDLEMPTFPKVEATKDKDKKREREDEDADGKNKRLKVGGTGAKASQPKKSKNEFKVKPQPIVKTLHMEKHKHCITGVDYVFARTNLDTAYTKINAQTDTLWNLGKQSPCGQKVSTVYMSIPSNEMTAKTGSVFPFTSICITHDEYNSLPLKRISLEYTPVSLVYDQILGNQPFFISDHEGSFVTNFKPGSSIHIYISNQELYPVMRVTKLKLNRENDEVRIEAIGRGYNQRRSIIYTLYFSMNSDIGQKWESKVWPEGSTVYTVQRAVYRMEDPDTGKEESILQDNSDLDSSESESGDNEEEKVEKEDDVTHNTTFDKSSGQEQQDQYKETENTETRDVEGTLQPTHVIQDTVIEFKNIVLKSTPYYSHYGGTKKANKKNAYEATTEDDQEDENDDDESMFNEQGIRSRKQIETPFLFLQKETIQYDAKETRVFSDTSNSYENFLTQLNFRLPHSYSLSLTVDPYSVNQFCEEDGFRQHDLKLFPRHFITKKAVHEQTALSVYEVYKFIKFTKNKSEASCQRVGFLCCVKYNAITEVIKLQSDQDHLNKIFSDLNRTNNVSVEMLQTLNNETHEFRGTIGDYIESHFNKPSEGEKAVRVATSAEIVKFFDDHAAIYFEVQNAEYTVCQGKDLDWFNYRLKLPAVCQVTACTLGSMYVPPTKNQIVNRCPVIATNKIVSRPEDNNEVEPELKDFRMTIMNKMDFYNPIVELIKKNNIDRLIETNKIFTKYCKAVYEDMKQPWRFYFNSFIKTPGLNFMYPCSFLSRDFIFTNTSLSLKWYPQKRKLKLGTTIKKAETDKDDTTNTKVKSISLNSSNSFQALVDKINQADNDIAKQYELTRFTNNIFNLIMQQILDVDGVNDKNSKYIVTPSFCNIVTGSTFDYNYPIRIKMRTSTQNTTSLEYETIPTVNIAIRSVSEDLDSRKKIQLDSRREDKKSQRIQSTVIIYNLNKFKVDDSAANMRSRDYVVVTNKDKKIHTFEVEDGLILKSSNILKLDEKISVLKEADLSDTLEFHHTSAQIKKSKNENQEENSHIDRGRSYVVTNDEDVHIVLGSPNSKLMIAAVSYDKLDEGNVFQYQIFLDVFCQRLFGSYENRILVDSDADFHSIRDSTSEYIIDEFWHNAIWQLKDDNTKKKDYFSIIRFKKEYLWLPMFKVENVFFLHTRILREWGYILDKPEEKQLEEKIISYSEFKELKNGYILSKDDPDFVTNLHIKQTKKGLPVQIGLGHSNFYLHTEDSNHISFRSNTIIKTYTYDVFKTSLIDEDIRMSIPSTLSLEQVRKYFDLTDLYMDPKQQGNSDAEDLLKNVYVYNNIHLDLHVDKKNKNKKGLSWEDRVSTITEGNDSYSLRDIRNVFESMFKENDLFTPIFSAQSNDGGDALDEMIVENQELHEQELDEPIELESEQSHDATYRDSSKRTTKSTFLKLFKQMTREAIENINNLTKSGSIRESDTEKKTPSNTKNIKKSTKSLQDSAEKSNEETLFNSKIQIQKLKKRYDHTKKLLMTYRVCIRNTKEMLEAQTEYYPFLLPFAGKVVVNDKSIVRSKSAVLEFVKKTLKNEDLTYTVDDKNGRMVFIVQDSSHFNRKFDKLVETFHSMKPTKKNLVKDFVVTKNLNWNKMTSIELMQDNTESEFDQFDQMSYRYRSTKVQDFIQESVRKTYSNKKFEFDLRFTSVPFSEIVDTESQHSSFTYSEMFSNLNERQRMGCLRVIHNLIRVSASECRNHYMQWVDDHFTSKSLLPAKLNTSMHSSFIDSRKNFLITEFEVKPFVEENTIEIKIKEAVQYIASFLPNQSITIDPIIVKKPSAKHIYAAVVLLDLPLGQDAVALLEEYERVSGSENQDFDVPMDQNDVSMSEQDLNNGDNQNVEVPMNQTDTMTSERDVNTDGTKEPDGTTDENSGLEDSKSPSTEDLDGNTERLGEVLNFILDHFVRSEGTTKNIADVNGGMIVNRIKTLITKALNKDSEALSTLIEWDKDAMTFTNKTLLRQLKRIAKNKNDSDIIAKRTLIVNQQDLFVSYMNSAFAQYVYTPIQSTNKSELRTIHYIIEKSKHLFKSIPSFCDETQIGYGIDLIQNLITLKGNEDEKGEIKQTVAIKTYVENTARSVPSLNIIIEDNTNELKILTAQTCLGWDIVIMKMRHTPLAYRSERRQQASNDNNGEPEESEASVSEFDIDSSSDQESSSSEDSDSSYSDES